MAIPDSGLGLTANFNADQFRNAIKFSMQMGLNPDTTRQPVFIRKSSARTYWRDGVQLTGTVRTDRDGRPLDASIEVRRTADVEVRVDCAVEVTDVAQHDLPVGKFKPSKLTVTLMEIDYAKVSDCREVIYNGDRYAYVNEPSSEGLFDAGIYTMVFYAIDES